MAPQAQAVTVSLQDLQNGMKSLAPSASTCDFLLCTSPPCRANSSERIDGFQTAHSHNPTFTTRATISFSYTEYTCRLKCLYSYVPENPPD